MNILTNFCETHENNFIDDVELDVFIFSDDETNKKFLEHCNNIQQLLIKKGFLFYNITDNYIINLNDVIFLLNTYKYNYKHTQFKKKFKKYIDYIESSSSIFINIKCFVKIIFLFNNTSLIYELYNLYIIYIYFLKNTNELSSSKLKKLEISNLKYKSDIDILNNKYISQISDLNNNIIYISDELESSKLQISSLNIQIDNLKSELKLIKSKTIFSMLYKFFSFIFFHNKNIKN